MKKITIHRLYSDEQEGEAVAKIWFDSPPKRVEYSEDYRIIIEDDPPKDEASPAIPKHRLIRVEFS